MHNYTKKFATYLFLISSFIAVQLSSVSYAQYDVIKARTVENENDINNEIQGEVKTFNDPDLPNFSQDGSVSSLLEKKVNSFIDKKRNKKTKDKTNNDIASEEINEVNSDVNSQTDLAPRQNAQSVSANQDEPVEEKNKFQINADKITYDDEEGNVYAKGHVEIISKAQGVTLKADEAVLDKPSQTIKLTDNVKILKDGTEMSGEYMLVDLNEQNILMDNPTMKAYSFIINAQEGYLIANDIQMLNGTIKSSEQKDIVLQTAGFMRFDNIGWGAIQSKDIIRESSDLSRKEVYKIDAKEIIVTSYKDHNSIVLKNSDISYGKHKIIKNSDIEILSDKKNQVIDTNSPEGGTMRAFGTYIGYGFIHKLPKGQILKLMPALVYGDSNIRVGLVARHRSKNSMFEAGYATATTNLVARGKYRFSDALTLNYGRNAYIPEGFMGARRSGYAAQLQYEKSYLVQDLNLSFNHGFYAGIFSDYQEHDQEEAYATTRFRYMAEINKSIFEYNNKEQDMGLRFSLLSQAQATIYGSGETVGVARFGPMVTTKVKGWESSLGYLIAGVHGDSPFIFDKYRYGKHSIMLNEKYNFNNKFAIGYRATITPLKDNYENDFLTESRFYVIFGPQDLKMILSYDFVRDVAHFDFMFLLGTESSKINFDKLTTKNIDSREQKRDFYRNAKRVKIEEPENI